MSKKSYQTLPRQYKPSGTKSRKDFQPKLVDQKTSILEKPLFLAVLILTLTFIAFYPSLKNGFIPTWDDGAYVLENQTIHNLNLSSIKEMFTTSVASSYVPLPLLTFAVEYKYFGLNPFVFHLTNLLFHLLCTLLVFQVLRMLKLNPIYAATGALIFGVHPMHVESVAWITERKDLLYTMFSLVSIILYIKYLNSQSKKLIFLFISIILFGLSLFSKITAVILPLSLLLIDYYFERPFKRKVIIEKIPFFILALVFGFAEMIVFQRQGALKTPGFISISDQVFVGCYALSAYIVKFFAPFYLSAIYPLFYGPEHHFPFLFYISPLFIVLIVFLIFRFARKNRAVLFGSLFFLVNIIMMLQSQIVTQGIGFLADRFSYLPYMGICFLIGWYGGKLNLNHKELKPFVPGALFIIILIFTIVTFNRNKVWENDFTLWNDVIEKYPDEVYKSYTNRGIAFTSLGQWNNAINDFNKVIDMDPNYGSGYLDRGVAYQNTNQWNKSIEDFSKAIEIDPNNLDAFAGRGVSYGVLGQSDKAIADLSRTIEIDPKFTKGYSNRGVTYATLGYSDKAIADYSKAIEIDPGFKDAYTNRSIAYGKLSQWDNAIADGEKAIKLNPENAGLYDKIGYYFLGKGEMDNAVQQFRKSISIDTKNFDALLGLAVVYYYKGDKSNAKNYLDQAKAIEARLNNGMDGIKELENLGYFKPANIKEILKNLLKELS